MQLAFFKIIVSFLLALALTWLAERKSLYWSGILTAFPNVSLFTMIFIALEQGVTFTTNSSLYGVYGVMNNMIFASVIILATFYISSVWIPFLLGILSYAIFGFFIVEYFPKNVYFALALSFLVWLSCLFIIEILRSKISGG
ncbi:hypothetical protein HZA97_08500 [Candidatus Woesearchaeota archaeon]|nr:hypothetical protein [Candidatus Woesearchaeota archaeon]